ncbi:BadF-type ATPase [Paenibacillus sp. UNCCL117]|uniref:BadF/BadG/BcrA/BcrD ATPase family protein n=1 Tax=unclassified Paenibacillus TaxID=185978 RepID=UPI0008865D3E|nr:MULTISPECIES: BadF/BadG/BcrA/BcrD ATPase family protein [unclassified Paenibacillus]SDD39338.1 BadF-type ATPase [Paenibacillus sp. cl123]SFW48391.1 BadF-type ATPase [Paenibacillus sp. UNCCL117]
MKLFIGVDGGGTKTDVYVADADGNELGRYIGGSTNPHSVGFEVASSRLGSYLIEALASVRAGMPENSHDREADASVQTAAVPAARYSGQLGVCLALSGVDTPEEREKVSRAITAILEQAGICTELCVTNDAESALMAALGREYGMLAIAGTGSIVFGRTPDGARYRVGGWGHLLGDGGSGYRIGLDALQAIMRSYDGIDPPTSMTKAVLESRGWTELLELKAYIYGPQIHKQHIAEFARVAIGAASEEDPAAMRIVKRNALELAAQAEALALKNRWFAQDSLGLGGSIFKHSALFESIFRSRLAEALPDLRLQLSDKPPAYGAARLAAARLSSDC